MPLVSRIPIILAMVCMTNLAIPVFAQSTSDYSTQDTTPFYENPVSFETTTDSNSPTFDRPLITPGGISNFTQLSSGQTHVGYAATDFTAPVDAQYRVTTQVGSGYPVSEKSSSNTNTSNFVQFVYAQSYDPTNPLNNYQGAYNPASSTGSYYLSLSSGSALTFVNGGYYNNDNDPSGNQYSLGTVKTTIDQYNPGTTQNIPAGDILGNDGVVSETLTLTGSDLVTSLNSFTFDGLQHNALGDLTATLEHDGISVTLFDQVDTNDLGALASFDGTKTYKFADTGLDLGAAAEAAVNSGDPASASYPLAGGTYQSQDPLSAFQGLGLAGAWTLSIVNHNPGSFGSFLGFSMNATTTPVPEASTSVSFGLGCGVFGLLLWKRRRTVSQSADLLS